MSTRRLIVAALLCGLAILGAGGALLVRTARNRDALTIRDVFKPGERAVIGATAVVLHASRTAGATTEIDIEVTSGAPLDDVAASFTLAKGATLVRPATPGVPSATGAVACRGLAAGLRTPKTCTLVFETVPNDSYFVSFAHDGKQVQWRLG